MAGEILLSIAIAPVTRGRDEKECNDMKQAGSGIVINTNEVVIRTATIEIKMMEISKRKITLSLFRQFKWAELIDRDTAQLNGVPWGLVNYYWPECDEGRPEEMRVSNRYHLHPVWQKGQELYRDCVHAQGHNGSALTNAADNQEGSALDLIQLALICSPDQFLVKPRADDYYAVQHQGHKNDSTTWYLGEPPKWHSWKLENSYYPSRWETDEESEKPSLKASYTVSYLKEILNPKNKSIRQLCDDANRMWKEGQELRKRSDALKKKWAAQYEALAALEQLYIA